MTTSPEQMSFLSEILEWKPIPKDKLVYFRERLRHKLHATILDAFLERSRERGLKQSDLAVRIHRKRAQITRWFASTSNLTLDSISDLMAGLGMDFDSFPFSPIEKTVVAPEQTRKQAKENAQIERIREKLMEEVLKPLLAAQGSSILKAPEPLTGALQLPSEDRTQFQDLQKTASTGSSKVVNLIPRLEQRKSLMPQQKVGQTRGFGTWASRK